MILNCLPQWRGETLRDSAAKEMQSARGSQREGSAVVVVFVHFGLLFLYNTYLYRAQS